MKNLREALSLSLSLSLSHSHADSLAHLRGRAFKLGYWHLHRADWAFGGRLWFFVAVGTAHNCLDVAAILLVDLSTVLLLEGGERRREMFEQCRKVVCSGGGGEGRAEPLQMNPAGQWGMAYVCNRLYYIVYP